MLHGLFQSITHAHLSVFKATDPIKEFQRQVIPCEMPGILRWINMIDISVMKDCRRMKAVNWTCVSYFIHRQCCHCGVWGVKLGLCRWADTASMAQWYTVPLAHRYTAHVTEWTTPLATTTTTSNNSVHKRDQNKEDRKIQKKRHTRKAISTFSEVVTTQNSSLILYEDIG